MKVVKVTEENGTIEFHVNEKLRKGSELNDAGIRLARVIELAGTGLNDYYVINTKSFVVKTGRVSQATFMAMVSQYGDAKPSLTFTWKKMEVGMVLEIGTNLVFSKRDCSVLETPGHGGMPKPPRIMTISKPSSFPVRSLTIGCLVDVDRQAVERFARSILG